MLLQQELRDDLRAVVADVRDWDNPGFDRKKAYACSLASALAYLHIPHFEIDQGRRTNVIPSTGYRSLATGRAGPLNLYEALGIEPGSETPYFVIVRRYLVIVGIRESNVIFVAIRGTQFLYEWLINARASR